MDKSILNWGPVSLTRRNHGLEHATLNLLAKKQPGVFTGHSDHRGFWIIGNVSTDLLLETVREALERMKAGEKSLAIHQNCGTNFVTTGLVAGSMTWLFTLVGANSFKKRMNRWSTLVMVSTIAAVLAHPLGFKMQEKQLVLISCIDNLVKGASGQAVQNMNIMIGCPETTALAMAPLYP